MGTALWGLCKSVADSFWSWNREVQRRASRLALGQRKGEMPYDGRPSSNEPLCPSSLSDRRLNLFSFIECFKIVFDLNNLRFWDYFELASNFKLLLKIAKFNCYKQLYFFYSTCAQMGRLITPVTDVVHARLQIYRSYRYSSSLIRHSNLLCDRYNVLLPPPPLLSHNTFLDLTLLYIKQTILFMLSYSKDDLFLWSHFDVDMFCWLTLCFYSILLPFLDGYQKGGLDKKQKNVLGVTPQDDQLISKLFLRR